MTTRMALTLLGLTLACAAVPAAALARAATVKHWSVVVEHCNADSYRHYRNHHHADALYRRKVLRFDRDGSIAVVAEEHGDNVTRLVQRRCG